MAEDEFTLFDLSVEVVEGDKPMVCGHTPGPAFVVRGEDLIFPEGGRFSFYSLAALLPLLAAKQRETAENDWMTSDAEISCPDPNCGARFRITRQSTSTFRHSETTVVPLPGKES